MAFFAVNSRRTNTACMAQSKLQTTLDRMFDLEC